MVQPPTDMSAGHVFQVNCSSINSLYSGSLILHCDMDTFWKYDENDCGLACPSSTSLSVMLRSTSFVVTTSTALPSGTSQLRSCADIHPGYEGAFTISCVGGSLGVDVAACMERSCISQTASVQVAVGGIPGEIGLDGLVVHHGSASVPCAAINDAYSGLLTVSCSNGSLILQNQSLCSPKACEVWHFVENGSHLVRPQVRLHDGAISTSPCISTEGNVWLVGEVGITCDAGNVSFVEASCQLYQCIEDGAWRLPCSLLHPLCEGDLQKFCLAGEMSMNSSGCSGVCDSRVEA